MKQLKIDTQLIVAGVAKEVKNWNGVGKKPLAVVSGKISEADIVNLNNFRIPLNEWEDMLNSSANQERLKLGKMYSTVGHDERPVEDFDVRHGEISHIITNLWIEGKDVFMTANVCDTQSGQDLMGVIGAGGYIQASTRLGIVPRTCDITGADCLVGKDSIIYGVDLVLDPAISSTYVEFKAASKTKDSSIKTFDLSSLMKKNEDKYNNLKNAISSVNNSILREQELKEFYKGLL